MTKKFHYLIVDRSYVLAVLHIGLGTEEEAWDQADYLASIYPEVFEDYDVLFFESMHELYSFIKNVAYSLYQGL